MANDIGGVDPSANYRLTVSKGGWPIQRDFDNIEEVKHYMTSLYNLSLDDAGMESFLSGEVIEIDDLKFELENVYGEA